MVDVIYTTIKATKKLPEFRIVSGFIHSVNVLFPRAVTPFLFEAESAFGKASTKELKTWLKATKSITVKGAKFQGTIQSAPNAVNLSRSERKTLFAAMRLIEQETGLTANELSALALAS